MKSTYFVTGTDTGVGKTFVTCALIHALNNKNYSTMALKPVAAGCEMTEEGLRNEDALNLIEAMSLECAYEQVNPITVEPAIAPHIALQACQRRVTVSQLEGYCRGALMRKGDICFIEGAGGWHVPINERELLSDLAIQLNTPVILVVGIRLGCINHGLLTAEAIRRDGLPIAGWIANVIDSNASHIQENIDTLTARISAPLLGILPYIENAAYKTAATYIDVEKLVNP